MEHLRVPCHSHLIQLAHCLGTAAALLSPYSSSCQKQCILSKAMSTQGEKGNIKCNEIKQMYYIQPFLFTFVSCAVFIRKTNNTTNFVILIQPSSSNKQSWETEQSTPKRKILRNILIYININISVVLIYCLRISKISLMLTFNHPQWLQYKILRSGLCAEICCNGGKRTLG